MTVEQIENIRIAMQRIDDDRDRLHSVGQEIMQLRGSTEQNTGVVEGAEGKVVVADLTPR